MDAECVTKWNRICQGGFMLLVPTVWTETEITKEYLTHLSCSPLALKAGWADKSSQSNLPCVQSGHPEIRRRHVMRNH